MCANRCCSWLTDKIDMMCGKEGGFFGEDVQHRSCREMVQKDVASVSLYALRRFLNLTIMLSVLLPVQTIALAAVSVKMCARILQ